uniref:Uncharacterized protein n=1 Tax=Rhizophora mucronata TaxID=61149 RepID=A0A2P2P0E8_RHIMU
MSPSFLLPRLKFGVIWTGSSKQVPGLAGRLMLLQMQCN